MLEVLGAGGEFPAVHKWHHGVGREVQGEHGRVGQDRAEVPSIAWGRGVMAIKGRAMDGREVQ